MVNRLCSMSASLVAAVARMIVSRAASLRGLGRACRWNRTGPASPTQRAVCMLGLLAAVFSCAACGSSTSSTSAQSATAPASPPADTSGASSTPATSPAPPATAPVVGTTLASPSQDAGVIANAAGDGFSVLTHSDGLTTYDAAGSQETTIPPTVLDPSCGALDLNVPGAGRLVITQTDTTQPAAGLNAAKTTLELDAWNAQTGSEVWKATVGHAQGNSGFCGPSENDFGAATYLGATADGRWIAVATGGVGGVVVNAVSGSTRSDPNLTGTIGDFILDGQLPTGADQATVTLVNPSTGAPVGSFRTGGPAIDLYSNANYGVDLALKGSFRTGDDSSSPPSGLTSDGHSLLAWRNNRVVAYSLPSMRQLWSTPADPEGTGYWLYGDGGGVAVVGKLVNDNQILQGLDDTTGHLLWQITQGSTTYCGLSTSEVQIDVNGDFTNLAIKTGQQVSYVADNGAQCSTILPGGISVNSSGAVVQTVTP
jgi:hypothetical protein